MPKIYSGHCQKANGSQEVYAVTLPGSEIITVNRPFHIPSIHRFNRVSDREISDTLPPGREPNLRPFFPDWTLCYIRNELFSYNDIKRRLLAFWRRRDLELELPAHTVQLCGPAIGIPDRPDGLMIGTHDIVHLVRLAQGNAFVQKKESNDNHNHSVAHDLLRASTSTDEEYYFYSDQSAW